MRYGLHLSTLQRSWGEDIFPLVVRAAEIGFDGVEFPLLDPFGFDTRRAKGELKNHQLSCTCCTGLGSETDISAADSREAGERFLRRCIEIAAELESDTQAGVIYAAWGKLISRSALVEQRKRSAEALNRLGGYAVRLGVTLALELINRYETSFLNSVGDGLAFLKEVDSDAVKLHVDTFHMGIEEKSQREALVTGGEEVWHVHICENDRGMAGSGQIDWRGVKEGLLAIGYDRWLTIENFVMPECEVGDALNVWRPVEPDGEATARGGLAFIKKLMKEE